jgi:hypothetical protein
VCICGAVRENKISHDKTLHLGLWQRIMTKENYLSKEGDHGKEEHPCSSWITGDTGDFRTTTRFTE